MPRYTLNHVAMAVPDIAAFLERSAALFGDWDQRGPLVNERQQVRELFLSDGQTSVELLEPLGSPSPLDGHLKRNPRGGLYHLAFDVDDLDEAVAHLEDSGGRRVTNPTPDVAFDERLIAFVLFGGQVVELIEREP